MAPAQKNGGETGNQQWPLVDSSEERRELNLLGYTIADALPLVERMIDQAVVHRCSRIRIIHGIGSGTLRKAIRKSLKENDYVKEFGPGGRNGGNDGVTVVEL